MYQPASEDAYSEPSIYACGQKWQVVEKMGYLGRAVNMTNTLDDEP